MGTVLYRVPTASRFRARSVFFDGESVVGLNLSVIDDSLPVEIGIDIAGHTSMHLDPYLNAGIDVVITVCDNANESCPVFPGNVARHHWGFEDPPKAAREGESEMDAFRRIRDEIRKTFEASAAGYRDAADRA